MRKYASSTIALRNLSICIAMLLASGVWAAAQLEEVVYSFGTKAGDGVGPYGGLIADAAGNLYGTTVNGGAGGFGTVYELSPPVGKLPWSEAVLYSFTGNEDGEYPWGTLVFDAAGNLYGTASQGGNASCTLGGCGTIFELSPPALPGGSWTETTLHAFGGGSDGIYPNGGVVFDTAGNLYGSTRAGGAPCGCGTVLELSPPTAPGGAWTEAVLYSFTGGFEDGAFPDAPVILDGAGNVYSTTFEGGSIACSFSYCGTVFELTPSNGGPWTETVIHNFGTGSEDGMSPQFAGLLLTKSGALVGTTPFSEPNGGGTVFGMLPPSSPGGQWSYAVLYAFGTQVPRDGLEPLAGVTYADGALYGTTDGGGEGPSGTVFQLSPAGVGKWKETGLYSFNGAPKDGFGPAAALLLHNGALFGTTEQGGSGPCEYGCGTVFNIRK
ncbi:MAG: choice-of-anchor tandem repeat GloVer-containing protein [Terriglobales bacterium]